MKTVRSLMTLAGVSLVLFVLGVTGARAQNLSATSFRGTFTLPFETQWGKMILPAGDYSLHYGQLFKGGIYAAVVSGKADRKARGMVLPQVVGSTSTTKNALTCIRSGNTLIVRALEIAGLRESIKFALPRGAKIVAHNGKHNGYTQLAEAPMHIERIPVTLSAK